MKSQPSVPCELIEVKDVQRYAGCWLLAISCWLVGFCWNTNDADFKDLRCFVLHIPQPSAFYELTEGKITQIVLAFCVFYSSTHTFNCCAMPIRGRKLATRNPQLTSTSTSISTSISTSTSFPFTISTQRSLVIIIFSIIIRLF